MSHRIGSLLVPLFVFSSWAPRGEGSVRQQGKSSQLAAEPSSQRTAREATCQHGPDLSADLHGDPEATWENGQGLVQKTKPDVKCYDHQNYI